jgi:formate-dependent nitrite reductase membrane component NrfD
MNVRDPSTAPQRPYRGPTYYGEPAVKSSSWGPLVSAYIWLGGLAGSAQVLASVADLLGREELRGLVRRGRELAAFLPVLGAGLLVADLHTPQRWYQMLRIFRRSSPMSIGSYLLGGFTASSLASAWAERRGRAAAARAAGLPAAAAGAGMSVYTGALLASTSTPLWSATPRLLAGRFAASSMATAAAALSLGETLAGQPRNAARLDRLAALAAAVEYGLGHAAERRWREQGIDSVLHEPRIAATRHAAECWGVLLPLACIAVNELAPRRSRTLSVAGAVGLLAGGLLMRSLVVQAGNRSAERPQDAFALAQGASQTPSGKPSEEPSFPRRRESSPALGPRLRGDDGDALGPRLRGDDGGALGPRLRGDDADALGPRPRGDDGGGDVE